MYMAGQYRASKERNRSRFYILLSVIFVIIMAKLGVPWMINTISGPERREATINGNDIIPPQQPAISALPEATNSARLFVEGYTESGAEVELLVNDVTAGSTRADEGGLFKFDAATLKLGQNRVGVTATDSAGNTSQSPVSLITFDNTPIVLTVNSPSNGSEYFGKANQTIEIKGEVNKDESQVLVNNSFALVEDEGIFIYRLMLSDGENTIKVIATDKSGNKDEAELKIIFHL